MFLLSLPLMEKISLDEVGEYNDITSPEDVEGEEVLYTILQKRKSKEEEEDEEVHSVKMLWKI